MNFKRAYSQELIDNLTVSMARLAEKAIICCPNCIHFSGKETCELNNLRPPAKIIAFGCERFELNDVPF